jgi:hypothetical protein
MQLRKVNIKPGPKRPPVVTSGKNTRRTAKQRQRVNADSSMGLYKTSPSYPMTPGSTSNPVKGYSKSGFRGQTFNIPRGVKISREGMAFLKCAFAPPDFGESLATGVPDSFEGTSLVKKHRYVISQSIPANTDRYYLFQGLRTIRVTCQPDHLQSQTLFSQEPNTRISIRCSVLLMEHSVLIL